MSRETSGTFLSAVFVDYDNIYLSLKRRNEEAAKLFAKDAYRWLRAIESGQLITSTNAPLGAVNRRLVMNRCYGNPVPRRNQSDNSTDMNSFPFVRHHFLRAGFEIIDCPPLTAQLKNSADIRMVMDMRDFLTHETRFDEFIILSGDADFTPLIHRLRAHARRTVIFANDHTAVPYTALSDGEVREGDLIDFLIAELELEAQEAPAIAPAADLVQVRNEILEEVVRTVLDSQAPQPLEALAERAIRVLGHARTVGSDWGGAGSFRDLLVQGLPASVALTPQAPYFVYDVSRTIVGREQQRLEQPLTTPQPHAPAHQPQTKNDPLAAAGMVASAEPRPVMPNFEIPTFEAPAAAVQPPQPSPAQQQPAEMTPERASSLQNAIAQIHQACKAPPFSPPEYRAMFTLIANEISTNQMQGHQTIDNVRALAREIGIDAKREDVRFIIDVVGKNDPWFEKGASATVFASRFRNYVIAQCQADGLQLGTDEIDLIDAWFAGSPEQAGKAAVPIERAPAVEEHPSAPPAEFGERTARWWQETAGNREADMAMAGDNDGTEEFPRIVRNRLRG